jgi:hypothetical protein
MIMTESIAKLHVVSYALKIRDNSKFNEIVESLRSFPFHCQEKRSMFDALYWIALERLFRHVNSTENVPVKLKAAIEKLHSKYIEIPSKLLQEFLDEDETFNILIHGDYNRNNVMFKYDSTEGFDNPKSLKMFDFQWLKYASPVLDLSFFLYMNFDPEVLEKSWEKVLKFYHETMMNSLTKILNCDRNDKRVKEMNYENFQKHFKKFAFYGTVISTWFVPIMLCELKQLDELVAELNKDLFSEKSKELTLPAGGKIAIERVMFNVQHAFDNGYIDRLLK